MYNLPECISDISNKAVITTPKGVEGSDSDLVSSISDPLKHLASIICINKINVNKKMFVSTSLQRLLD